MVMIPQPVTIARRPSDRSDGDGSVSLRIGGVRRSIAAGQLAAPHPLHPWKPRGDFVSESFVLGCRGGVSQGAVEPLGRRGT